MPRPPPSGPADAAQLLADITPVIPAGKQIIQSYGDGAFRIADTLYSGSVLVFPDRTLAWPVATRDALTLASLTPVVEAPEPAGILLIGGGRGTFLLDPALRGALGRHGIVADAMDTGAACRTFNVLLGEDRHVVAALIAV